MLNSSYKTRTPSASTAIATRHPHHASYAFLLLPHPGREKTGDSIFIVVEGSLNIQSEDLSD
jgi:hypothetical protein